MSLIPNLSDIPDLAPVEDGEYHIKVTSAKSVTSQDTQRPGIQLGCQIDGHPDAETVFHKMWFPMESDPEDKANIMWRMIKDSCVGFGLGADGVEDAAEFIGCEADVVLKSREYGGRISNEIARFL